MLQCEVCSRRACYSCYSRVVDRKLELALKKEKDTGEHPEKEAAECMDDELHAAVAAAAMWREHNGWSVSEARRWLPSLQNARGEIFRRQQQQQKYSSISSSGGIVSSARERTSNNSRTSTASTASTPSTASTTSTAST